MENVLTWWLASTLLGLLAAPYAYLAFPRLADRGLCFVRPLGLLLTTYVMWMLAVVGVIPNGRGAALLAVILVGAGAVLIFKRHRPELVAFLRRYRSTLVTYEVVYLAAFLACALVRAYNPQLDSTEKPMDLAMLTSALRSPALPPADPWLSGFAVNYYYMGYLMMATLAHLAGAVPAVGFNLSLAFLFGSTAVGMLGLVGGLVAMARGRTDEPLRIGLRVLRYGMLGCVILLLAGNLVGVLEFLRAHGFAAEDFWRWVSIKKGGDGPDGALALLGVAPGDMGYISPTWYPDENWWWWRSTRLIDTIMGGKSADYTITEFPFFSFLLGDLHPHVMSLPFVLLALGMCLQVFLQPAGGIGVWWRERRVQGGFLLLILGSLGFINGWDLAPYIGLFFAVTAVRTWLDYGFSGWRPWGEYASWVLLMVLAAVVLYGWFYAPLAVQLIQARAPTSDVKDLPIRFWAGPSTRPLHFVMFWFVHLLLCGGLLWAAVRRNLRGATPLVAVALAMTGTAWILAESWWFFSGGSNAGNNGFGLLLQRFWLLAPIAIAATVLLARRRHGTLRAEGDAAVAVAPVVPAQRTDAELALRFAAGLLLAALTLMFLSEMVYVQDVFSNRMNTVFKLYYQSWLWVSVASAFGVAYVATGLSRGAVRLWRAGVAAVVALCLVYAVTALPNKTAGFAGPPTLDGIGYLAQAAPGELDALRWLADRPAKDEVVLEAAGPQYSLYGRAATVSGIPGVLGWAGHEVQWRGTDAMFRDRPGDIDAIYNAPNKASVTGLLDKYRVTYIYVGNLEASRYPRPALDAFRDVFPIAFTNGTVTIYRVRALADHA